MLGRFGEGAFKVNHGNIVRAEHIFCQVKGIGHTAGIAVDRGKHIIGIGFVEIAKGTVARKGNRHVGSVLLSVTIRRKRRTAQQPFVDGRYLDSKTGGFQSLPQIESAPAPLFSVGVELEKHIHQRRVVFGGITLSHIPCFRERPDILHGFITAVDGKRIHRGRRRLPRITVNGHLHRGAQTVGKRSRNVRTPRRDGCHPAGTVHLAHIRIGAAPGQPLRKIAVVIEYTALAGFPRTKGKPFLCHHQRPIIRRHTLGGIGDGGCFVLSGAHPVFRRFAAVQPHKNKSGERPCHQQQNNRNSRYFFQGLFHPFSAFLRLCFIPIVIAQMPEVLQFRIIPLAQHLIGAHRNGIGQVQTARLTNHRQTHAAVGIVKQQLFGKPRRFFAKDEIGIVGIGNVRMRMTRLRGKIIKLTVCVFGKKILQRGIIGDIEQVPVIQSRPFELFIIQLKSQRLHQMKPCACRRAGAGNIAGILWYFRFDKYNIKGCHSP